MSSTRTDGRPRTRRLTTSSPATRSGSLARTVPEPSFRAYRLNQKVDEFGTWIVRDDWAARTDAARVVHNGDDVVLGFDGSYSGDSTAAARMHA